MDKKKLVIASDCFLPRWDGISRFLLELIPSLTKRYEITVIAPDFKGREIEFQGVEILRVPLSKIKVGDFQIAKSDKNILEEPIKNADVVWVHTMANIGRNAINISNKHNKPVVTLIHSIDYELVARSLNLGHFVQDSAYFISKKYLTKYYNRCSLIMSPSKNVDEMLEWNYIKTPKVNINIGVNLNEFVPPRKRATAKEEVEIDPEAQVIGFCGRIAKEKNLETLHEAFKRIRSEFPKAILLIVGEGLKKYETMLENSQQVMFVGAKDNVVPYLQAMDIFVLPSLVETTSLATLEAMACEAAPICTPVGYVKDYIKEKVNGMTFPIRNPTVLAVKLKQLLKDDRLRRRLGRNARKIVEKQFNLEDTKKEILKILKNAENSY